MVKLLCAEGDAGAGDGEARLRELPRAELQALAKVNGLKANAKSDLLVAELLKAGVRPGDIMTSPQKAAPLPVSEAGLPSEDVRESLSRGVVEFSDVGAGAENEGAEETEPTVETEEAQETEEQLGVRVIAEGLDGFGTITIEDNLELFCKAASFAPRFSPTCDPTSPQSSLSRAPASPDPPRPHHRLFQVQPSVSPSRLPTQTP